MTTGNCQCKLPPDVVELLEELASDIDNEYSYTDGWEQRAKYDSIMKVIEDNKV